MALSRTRTFLFAAACAWLVSGCLSPAGVDVGAIDVYQRQLAHGPQFRAGDRSLALLRPLGKIAPPLLVRPEPNGALPVIDLSLKDAVLRALAQNTDIRVVSYDPEITHQQSIEAAAAFDATAYGSYQQSATHEIPRQFSSPTDSQTRTLQAGVKSLTPTGGTWNVAYTMTRMWDNSQFVNIAPTTYQPVLALEVAQPLLRDAWPEYNLARLHIAEANEKISHADFRAQVEQTVSDVITAYWALWEAQREVLVRQEVLQNARDTLQKVRDRAPIDAAAAEISQAEAAVRQREVTLEVAVKTVGDAQDALVKLLADPQINLLGDFQINPISLPAESRVTIDNASELRTAMEYNPALERARLAITVGDLNIVIAKNQALPRLDLTGTGSYSGLDPHAGEAHEILADLGHFDYSLGLAWEYPPGNRQRLAELEVQKLSRLQIISQLQSTADQIAVAVRERVREIGRSYHEIELDRALVKALEVELQALEDTEKNRGRLTPEFLRLKLDTQSSLGDAKIAEFHAVRAYNQAISDLSKDTGTILKQYSVDLLLPPATGEAPWPESKEWPTPASRRSPAAEPAILKAPEVPTATSSPSE
jgi:outer membrane protein TolC